MSGAYDEAHWERLWATTLREHPDKVEGRGPNTHLVRECGSLPPGRALDAGCGHGVEALWLAARGWRVTAVDFAASAVAKGRATEAKLGVKAEPIAWVCGGLESGTARGPFDLVVCLYVHAATGAEALVETMAASVDIGGLLFMVGHRPFDPTTGTPTAAAGQHQVSLQSAQRVLGVHSWEWVVKEERPRTSGGGVDAVICARRQR